MRKKRNKVREYGVCALRKKKNNTNRETVKNTVTFGKGVMIGGEVGTKKGFKERIYEFVGV